MKGLSPLIATVLLIAFTIAVAGIISNFLISFSSEQSEESTSKAGQELECVYSGLYIREASYNSTGKNLTLTVRNSGRQDLSSFKLEAVFSNNSIEELTFTPALTEMEPGDEAVFSNNSYVTCTDLDRLIFRSNTCPSDARDEIGSEDISGC